LWKPKHILERKYSFIYSQTIQKTYFKKTFKTQINFLSKYEQANNEKVLRFFHLQPHKTKKLEIERKRRKRGLRES
jgi:hypothetical protein